MTFTINLPPATVEKLQAHAAASGKDVDTFVREAVEAKLLVFGLSFRGILEPIHREVVESGVSEEEIAALAEEAVRTEIGRITSRS